MGRWNTEKQFSSFLGLCPNNLITGGKILRRAPRKVYNRAADTLRLSAQSLTHSKSVLGAKYRRLRARLGAPKAIVAMAHHLARLVSRMLRYGEKYVEKGIEHYEQKFRLQRIKWLKKQHVSQTCLYCQQNEGVITSARPSELIRSGQQGIDFDTWYSDAAVALFGVP